MHGNKTWRYILVILFSYNNHTIFCISECYHNGNASTCSKATGHNRTWRYILVILFSYNNDAIFCISECYYNGNASTCSKAIGYTNLHKLFIELLHKHFKGNKSTKDKQTFHTTQVSFQGFPTRMVYLNNGI